MGLALEVGIVADLSRNDPEGCTYYREQFERLSRLLVADGLKAHVDPEGLTDEEVWSGEMHGYYGLHRLRRIAAHLALDLGLPGPAKDDAFDPVAERYHAQATGGGLLSKLFRRRPAKLDFAHLMLHSDAEGFYLPQDFPDVFIPHSRAKIAGEMVGSAPRLLDECRRLAAALAIPDGLDPWGDEVTEALAQPAPAAQGWRRYPVETFGCLQLMAACEASIRTGAAIVFC
jgi:hypothetical protein